MLKVIITDLKSLEEKIKPDVDKMQKKSANMKSSVIKADVIISVLYIAYAISEIFYKKINALPIIIPTAMAVICLLIIMTFFFKQMSYEMESRATEILSFVTLLKKYINNQICFYNYYPENRQLFYYYISDDKIKRIHSIIIPSYFGIKNSYKDAFIDNENQIITENVLNLDNMTYQGI